jgi:cell division septal protein FtsQ
MFKRRTSRVSHRRQVIELQAHVMSPRIAWFGLLKSFRKLAKFAFILALIGGAVWGVRLGIRRGLVENKEFRLQAIKLTPNPAIDQRDLVRIAGIDINGSLFECDAAEIESRLRALPALSSASVRREFPGTLVAEVTAREPHAWIASPAHGIGARDPRTGLLVDRSGFAFACPPALLARASKLPVFHLGEGGEEPAAGRKVVHPEFDRLMALYQVACQALPGAPEWIESFRQNRKWSLQLVSRDGIEASFGLGDHPRQMADLKAVLDHARSKDQQIASIELIPERNLPVILRGEGVPRAILVDEPEAAPALPDRRERDLQKLLNR